MPPMKMLSTWLLLSTLTLVNLQHLSLPRGSRHPDCVRPDLLKISEFFRNTTIVRLEDTTEVKYCAFMDDDDAANKLQTLMDLDTVIDLYTTLDYVNSYKIIDGQGPVTRDGALSINDEEELPLYQIADIRKKHLMCQSKLPGFGVEVNAQMKLMNLTNTDGRGYLLAHSLGGESNVLNVIPMAVNVYWHQNYDTKYTEVLGAPQAFWRSNEYWIRRFILSFYPNGRVHWKIALQYDKNVFLNPKMFRSYRPISFSLQYVAYTNEYDENSIYYESPLLTFRNDNHYSCTSINFCGKDVVMTPEAEVEEYNKKHPKEKEPVCDIQKAEPEGKIGSEILDQKDWASRHEVAFPYYIRGKTYFYVQNEDKSWFIHELLPGGIIGEETETGTWNVVYKYSFTYFINGTHYMYAHNHEDKSWFIRELLPFGRMGEVTEKDVWGNGHWFCHGFTINGKHYFLTQWTDKILRINELLPNGKMGNVRLKSDEVSFDPKTVYYIPFHINNKLVITRYVQENKHWDLYTAENEIDDFKLTKEGIWDHVYHVLFTYVLKGRRFIYGLATETPYNWFIRKILPNGESVNETLSSGTENSRHLVAFPFSINGRQYLYKQLYDTRKGEIREFL